MINKLYPKLACIAIKNNKRMYGPYLLASMFTIGMMYIVTMLTGDKGVSSLPGAASLKMILFLGSVTIAVFSIIFLFYTNSFLMKQRKKEIGLYNILGMEKKHIGFVLFWETLISAAISIAGGIISGILFYDLILMILYKLLNTKMHFTFYVSVRGMQIVILIYSVIYITILLFNLLQIHLANPIHLLQGSEVGEREPKTKWISTVLGILCLGLGYFLALTTESPLSALFIFFIAVILVILGTYFLFSACSIAILKALKHNKNYYYQKKHFTNISGLLYRMKQNAAGLSNICILSTMVLVTLSTTVSLYLGSDDSINRRYPRDFCMDLSISDTFDEASFVEQVQDLVTERNLQITNVVREKYHSMMLQYQDNCYTLPEKDQSYDSLTSICLYNPEDFQILTGISVKEPEKNVLYQYGISEKNKIQFLGKEYEIQPVGKGDQNSEKILEDISDGFSLSKILIGNKETIDELTKQAESSQLEGSYYSPVYKYYFNTTGTKAQKEDLYQNGNFGEKIKLKENENVYVSNKQINEQVYYGTYGGFLFLGIILGSLFLVVTALIIYYKQVSEGYDDRQRFQIMKKVGMNENEVKLTIRNQILKVFFLPVAVATVHVAFAFKVITKMLLLFGLDNTKLFILCTLGTIVIFIVVYVMMYLITAKVYYRIVDEN